jgi:integrase
MENALTFAQQAEAYIADIAGVARPNTLHVYRSILDRHILPAIGGVKLETVDNLIAKSLVGRLTEARLSPATIGLAVTLVKQVVKSAVDGRGNRLYPVVWNPDYIKAPSIDTDSQKTSITAPQTLQEAITATNGEIKALVVILAATGLRIGEALAIGLGNTWDPIQGTITVSGTLVMGTFQPNPKTKAGKRVVDLPSSVNALLKTIYPTETAQRGVLFPLSRRRYHEIFAGLGIHGFHSLRRFRITHLELNDVPRSLTKFWAGHAGKDITARYTKVGAEITARKDWSEKAGTGFTL